MICRFGISTESCDGLNHLQFLQQWMGAATEAYSDLNSSLIEANCLQHLNVLATTLLLVSYVFAYRIAGNF